MRFIIEMTGPVVDPAPRYWAAYTQVAREMSLPRIDRADFWRLVRRGDPHGRWVPGAKPAQAREFQQRFDAAIEADEVIALQTAHANVSESLTRLRRHGDCQLITNGANRMARQLVLDKLDLSVHFSIMRGLPDDQAGRVRTLKEMAEGEDRVLVVAASEEVTRAGIQGGLIVAGISAGAAVSARLARVGASPIFNALSELADEVESGGERLVQAGLLPPKYQFDRNPFVTADHAFASRGRGGASSSRGARRR